MKTVNFFSCYFCIFIVESFGFSALAFMIAAFAAAFSLCAYSALARLSQRSGYEETFGVPPA